MIMENQLNQKSKESIIPNREVQEERNKSEETTHLSNHSNDNKENLISSKEKSKQKKTAMHEDIEEMMYGFGDTQWPPDFEAVKLIEQMVAIVFFVIIL